MTFTILIVEDDPKIAEIAAKNLEAAGFQCHVVPDGPTGLKEFRERQPSLVILDLMLPGMDGLEITRRVRETSRVPILMLTARSSDADKVLGLEIGADDYMTKPFSTQELVARVRALLRRSTYEEDVSLQFGDLAMDVARREVSCDSQPLDLTSLEFDLLHLLITHPGRVYSREALMHQVWGEDRVVDERSIDSLVSRLRRKITRASKKGHYVQTVWGAGYRLSEQS